MQREIQGEREREGQGERRGGVSLLFLSDDARTDLETRGRRRKLSLLSSSSYQRLLVPRRELRDVAEIHVGDPPVPQREDVARVRVSVEQAKFEQLPQPGDDAAADKRVDVYPGRDDGGRVGAAHPVDPLHREHSLAAQVVAHPRDLDRGIPLEVAAEVTRVARLQGVVELLQQLLAKLVDDQLGVAAEPAQRERRDEPRERPEDDEVREHQRLDPGALHLDGHVGAVVAQHRAVHLPQGRRRDRALRDRLERGAQRAAELGLDDRKRLVVREGRHVVLQRAQLVHVVLPHDVGAGGQDLAGLDEGGTEGDERAAELRSASPDDGRRRGGGLGVVAGEERRGLRVRRGVARRGEGLVSRAPADPEEATAAAVAPERAVPERRGGEGAEAAEDLQGAAGEPPRADPVGAQDLRSDGLRGVLLGRGRPQGAVAPLELELLEGGPAGG